MDELAILEERVELIRERLGWVTDDMRWLVGRAAKAERENSLLREELRIREESQIPVIPRAAVERMNELEERADKAEEALAGYVTLQDQYEDAILKLADANETLTKIDSACEALSDRDAEFIRAVLAARPSQGTPERSGPEWLWGRSDSI